MPSLRLAKRRDVADNSAIENNSRWKMKHTRRSINKATERYVLFLRGVMDATLLGHTLFTGKHYVHSPEGRKLGVCSVWSCKPGFNKATYKLHWSCATGVAGYTDTISPEDARLVVREYFISKGIPVEVLDRIENRG